MVVTRERLLVPLLQDNMEPLHLDSMEHLLWVNTDPHLLDNTGLLLQGNMELLLVDSMATLVDLAEDMGDHLKVHPQVLIQLYGAGFRFVLLY